MARVQALADRHAQLQLAQALVGRLDLGRLLPRRRHQRFLMLLDRPACRAPPPMRQRGSRFSSSNQFAAPGVTVGAPRMPAAVERRREQRIGRRRDRPG